MPIIDVKIESPMQNCIDWNNPPLFKLSKVCVKKYWEFVTLTLLKMILQQNYLRQTNSPQHHNLYILSILLFFFLFLPKNRKSHKNEWLFYQKITCDCSPSNVHYHLLTVCYLFQMFVSGKLRILVSVTISSPNYPILRKSHSKFWDKQYST